MGELNRHFIVGETGIALKMDLSVHHAQSAGDVLQSQTFLSFVERFKIDLFQSASIVMDPQEELPIVCILRQMNEAGIAVFEDVIDQLLYHAEND